MTRVFMILSLLFLVQRILAPIGVDILRDFKMAREMVDFLDFVFGYWLLVVGS